MMARSTVMPESFAARREDPVIFSLTPKEVRVSTNCPTTTSTRRMTSGQTDEIEEAQAVDRRRKGPRRAGREPRMSG